MGHHVQGEDFQRKVQRVWVIVSGTFDNLESSQSHTISLAFPCRLRVLLNFYFVQVGHHFYYETRHSMNISGRRMRGCVMIISGDNCQCTSPRRSSSGPRTRGRGSLSPDMWWCTHCVMWHELTWSHEPDTERWGSRPEQLQPAGNIALLTYLFILSSWFIISS